jgi:hypothetical protein
MFSVILGIEMMGFFVAGIEGKKGRNGRKATVAYEAKSRRMTRK